ncbi:MAG: prepilin-type N-terminal cleavage/methylation domain-containing protein [Verrucomicrobiota bacterium]
MGYKIISNKKRHGAMTLPEMMVAIALGSIVFLAVGSLTLYSARSFSSMVNYSDLNQTSRTSLDYMTLGIRQSRGLQSRTPTNLVFKLDAAGSNLLTYTWNQSSKTLFQVTTTGTNIVTDTLLTNCTFWTNETFQRNTVSNSFALVSTTNPALTKLIQLNWTCAERRVNATNTESIQSMKIVIRKKG